MKRLREWMFGYGSHIPLGVFRILAGGLAFINLAFVFLDFEVWFTERGLTPEAFAKANHGSIWRLSLLNGVTDDRITLAVYLGTMLAALLTTVGLFTRVSAALLFLGVISLHARNMDILHSGDTLMRAWIFILMISPCGAALSVDRWLRVRRGKEPIQEISLWPQRMVVIQLAIVYITTVWHKLLGVHWLDGTATWYTSQLTEFEHFPTPPFFSQMPFIAIETYFALGAEVAMGTLVFWKRARSWVILAGLALHAGIEYSMNIPLFAAIITAGYVAHYSGAEITRACQFVTSKIGRKVKEEAHA